MNIARRALKQGYITEKDIENIQNYSNLKDVSDGEKLFILKYITREQYLALLSEVEENQFSSDITLGDGDGDISGDITICNDKMANERTIINEELSPIEEEKLSSDKTYVLEAEENEKTVMYSKALEDDSFMDKIKNADEKILEHSEKEDSKDIPETLKDSPHSKKKGGSSLQSIGPYELVKELGKGGMGKVYLAYHRDLKTYYALKTILHINSEKDILRFKREAQIMAKLQHPNIVGVHHIGREGKTHYIVMDYITGKSIDKYLENKSLSPREAMVIIKNIAETLHYAHENGVIHRDIKPGNIMIDEKKRCMLMDFGLAKPVSVKDELTKTGALIGTPYYMAPEQTLGKQVDARADVYALGCVLYELLTRKKIFDEGNIYSLLHQICTKDPIRPRNINPRIASDIESICLKAVEKQAAARYQSAKEFAHEIECYLKGEIIKAQPTTRFRQFIKWTRRNRAFASLLFGSIFVILTLGVVFTFSKIRDMKKIERNRKLKEEALKTALVKTQQALRFFRKLRSMKEVRDVLEETFRLASQNAHPSEVLRKIDYACERTPDYYGVWQARGKILFQYSNDHRYKSRWKWYRKKAKESLYRALKLHKNDYLSWELLGRIFLQEGNKEDYSECMDEIARISPENEYGMYARAMVEFGRSHLAHEKTQKRKHMQKAMSLLNNSLRYNPRFYLAILAKGQCYFSIGNRRKAKELFLYACDIKPKDGAAFFHLGTLYYTKKDYVKANKMVTQALKLSNGSARVFTLQAQIYFARRKPIRALSALRQALYLNPYFVKAYQVRMAYYKKQKKYTEVAKDYAKLYYIKPYKIEYAYMVSKYIAKSKKKSYYQKAVEYLRKCISTKKYTKYTLRNDADLEPILKLLSK